MILISQKTRITRYDKKKLLIEKITDEKKLTTFSKVMLSVS